MTRSAVTLGALCLLAPAVWAADICEPLREQIEVQIAATGATGFAVIVVDAETVVVGKVVGTCAKGARKLVYVRGVRYGGAAAPAAKPPAAAPQAKAVDDGIITECRDGTVLRGNVPCRP